jgi:hypothetical protein
VQNNASQSQASDPSTGQTKLMEPVTSQERHETPPTNRTKTSSGVFLWYLNDACVPRPQRCEELYLGERNSRKRLIVGIKHLTAEEMLEPLDVLAARYPVHLCDPV